jgi:hypothetical protein
MSRSEWDDQGPDFHDIYFLVCYRYCSVLDAGERQKSVTSLDYKMTT